MTTSQKVALITGAARRIGAETARLLHEAGFNIVLHYHHSTEEAQQLCTQLNNKRGHSAMLLPGDLADISHLQHLVKSAAQEWGRLDVLVNNASRFYRTPLGKVTENMWDDLLVSNLKAPFFLAQAALPFLREKKGCIINIADVHAERPLRDYGVYCISKAGLVMLTQSLAKECGPEIRVNAVSPGPVMWPEGENVMTVPEKEKVVGRTALKRHGSPEDIAKAVLFLVTAADYITGIVLPVDGGRSLTV